MSDCYVDTECHEEVASEDWLGEPCGAPAVGYRVDGNGRPYPVCVTHLRPPYWLTARWEVSG